MDDVKSSSQAKSHGDGISIPRIANRSRPEPVATSATGHRDRGTQNASPVMKQVKIKKSMRRDTLSREHDKVNLSLISTKQNDRISPQTQTRRTAFAGAPNKSMRRSSINNYGDSMYTTQGSFLGGKKILSSKNR